MAHAHSNYYFLSLVALYIATVILSCVRKTIEMTDNGTSFSLRESDA